MNLFTLKEESFIEGVWFSLPGVSNHGDDLGPDSPALLISARLTSQHEGKIILRSHGQTVLGVDQEETQSVPGNIRVKVQRLKLCREHVGKAIEVLKQWQVD